jgi:hypothetical protein
MFDVCCLNTTVQQVSLVSLSAMPNLIEIRGSLRRDEDRNILPSHCKCILWPFVVLVRETAADCSNPAVSWQNTFDGRYLRSDITGREITTGNRETVAVAKWNSCLD